MSTQEDGTARRSTLVTDGELTTRLLAFLQGPTGSAPEAAGDLPAADAEGAAAEGRGVTPCGRRSRPA